MIMARMNNELFHFLVSRNIFKNYYQTHRCSEKTEQRRFERNRGVMLWISIDMSKSPETGLRKNTGRGTYIRSLHGELKNRNRI